MNGQDVLFAMTRDWRPAARQSDHERFRLTGGAQRLLDELIELTRNQQWEDVPRSETIRTLKILLAWIGADAPIQEEDVHNLSQLRAGLSAKRVVQFLEPRGLLVPDAERRKDPDLRVIEQIIAGYPETIADELRVWVKVMRGEGRWEHAARSYHSIRRYFHPVGPILDGWATRVTSLREITNQDVKDAISTRHGNPGRLIHIVLRNLFRALKQERVIFRDPTRGLIFGGIQMLPDSVPSDRLQGVLDHAGNPFERFIVILVAVHALAGTTIPALLHKDLDLAAGRLTVRRGSWRHTVFLDDLSHQVAADWITERHRRWPGTTNPHLLVSQQSAMHTGHPPISTSMFDHVFRRAGLTMQQVRQDRILYEARETTDPLHLMRVFGISDGTAMRYITAAHPERTTKLPR